VYHPASFCFGIVGNLPIFMGRYRQGGSDRALELGIISNPTFCNLCHVGETVGLFDQPS
jgi:hypothetical protein